MLTAEYCLVIVNFVCLFCYYSFLVFQSKLRTIVVDLVRPKLNNHYFLTFSPLIMLTYLSTNCIVFYMTPISLGME